MVEEEDKEEGKKGRGVSALVTVEWGGGVRTLLHLPSQYR